MENGRVEEIHLFVTLGGQGLHVHPDACVVPWHQRACGVSYFITMNVIIVVVVIIF